MQKILIHVSALSIFVAGLPVTAAVYKEAGGRVVIEAEHFDKRTTNTADMHHWQIVPDENGNPDTPTDPGFNNARGGKYMQSLPDNGQNKNTDTNVVGIDGYLEYKVQINNPGLYRLYLRWGGFDGASDSIYAQIRELMTTAAPAGPGPDWYRYGRNNTGRFAN